MSWTFRRSLPANDTSTQSFDYISWSQGHSDGDSSRSLSYRSALIPVVVGVTASVVIWTVTQVLVLAVALGAADYSAGRPGLVTPVAYAVLSAAVAGLSLAVGATITRHRLLATDTAEHGVRVVALAQCAALVLLVSLHGMLTAHPSPVAVGLLLAGAAIGGVLGSFGGRLSSR
jgi:hypothetical protein